MQCQPGRLWIGGSGRCHAECVEIKAETKGSLLSTFKGNSDTLQKKLSCFGDQVTWSDQNDHQCRINGSGGQDERNLQVVRASGSNSRVRMQMSMTAFSPVLLASALDSPGIFKALVLSLASHQNCLGCSVNIWMPELHLLRLHQMVQDWPRHGDF